MTLPDYDDPFAESVLRMGPDGTLVTVSTAASVSARVQNAFDRQHQKGSNFGRKKFLGVSPATFTVAFIILPEEESAFWADVAPMLRPKGPKGNAPPLDVECLQINRWGVSTVTVLSADVDQPNARDGRTVTIELEEWTPAPVTPKTDTSRKKVNRDPLGLSLDALTSNQKSPPGGA